MKLKSLFICQTCGYSSPKWMGRCPDCNGWNTIAEETVNAAPAARSRDSDIIPFILDEIQYEKGDRLLTGIGEFDRVLGGGIVPGSVVLIGGDPGIGKSTLLLQVAEKITGLTRSVLYISGEESPSTPRRARRAHACWYSVCLSCEPWT